MGLSGQEGKVLQGGAKEWAGAGAGVSEVCAGRVEHSAWPELPIHTERCLGNCPPPPLRLNGVLCCEVTDGNAH